jgi:hypothetical protein
MKLQDLTFSNKFRQETDFMDFVNEVRNILNLGRYQMRVVTTVPDWTGEGGEHLLYISGTVKRFYWYDDINSTWQFIEWNNSGLGQVTIVATAQLTGQTADISTATLYTPAEAGLYRINVYMICTTAGGGTLSCTIGWTDIIGAKTLKPTADVDLASTANGAVGTSFISSGASAITYATAIANKTGSPQYALYLVLERLV